MIKFIVFIVALVIGFSGGMYYGVHHPEDAARLSDMEQQKLLELKIQATEAVKEQLDKKIAAGSAKTTGAGFLSSAISPNQSLVEVRDDQDRQLQDMKQQLEQMKKK